MHVDKEREKESVIHPQCRSQLEINQPRNIVVVVYIYHIHTQKTHKRDKENEKKNRI